jgi:hypothetical protein
VDGGSRQHTKIRAEGPGSEEVGPIGDNRDDPRTPGPGSDFGEAHPTVEGREREVDHDRVEVLADEARQGVGTIGGHGQLDVVDVDCRLNREHTRDHCHSSMSRHRRASVPDIH